MRQLLMTASLFLGSCFSAFSQEATVMVNAFDPTIQISRHIYGHFSEHLGHCIYDGFWVSDTSTLRRQDRLRLDIVDALKEIKIPNLRWPGGCFADEYHWRDGIGPRKQRPKMVNTNWGNITEDNSFGTHEFLELCELLHCQPYITANVGSGTVEEMSKWVEYLNFDGVSPMTNVRKENGHAAPWNVQFWGVGNESWGCGGNMSAEYYADQFKRYASFCKNYPNAPLKKIAGGPNAGDYSWTETLMKNIPLRMMWGISLHYYTIPTGSWSNKGSATSFDEKEYFNTLASCLKMDELITKHSNIMDQYDPGKKVSLVVDEWGVWTNTEPGTNPAFLYQQNSMRDALVAASTLNIFNNHSDRVRMANLAQTVNVLQSLILTRGQQMLLTPTYWVFDLYKVHQDAQWLPVQLHVPDYTLNGRFIPAINVSASRDSAGEIHISLVNLDPHRSVPVKLALNTAMGKQVAGQILHSAAFTDVNSFEQPDKVKPVIFDAFKKEKDGLLVNMPPLSIVVLVIK